MLDQTFDFIVARPDAARSVHPDAARPIHVLRPDALAAFLDTLPTGQAGFLRDSGFGGKSGELRLLPGPDGVAAAALGIGTDTSPFAFGNLPAQLPAIGPWCFMPGDYDAQAATLGYCLGAYRYSRFVPEGRKSASPPEGRKSASPPEGRKSASPPEGRKSASLYVPDGHETSLSQAAATWMVRDLINTPPNILGPVELADFAVSLADRYGAESNVFADEALDRAYPTIAAVGRGSARPPRVVIFHWRGRSATDASPLLSLCGKGVCFDTGGYDLKTSAGMLRMKKDMGGAATVLGLARIVMEADLPLRLAVRIGCVENSVSGTAMRPSDVITTRSGLTVEVGNTDAEGRLVLCDLLDQASEENPSLLVDCATLTGAARVALGPDLPALFSNDDSMAEALLQCGTSVHDPLWRLPLWSGYDDWLKSPIADLNNVSSRPLAGSIVAALYLQRFVKPGIPWMHLDLYAWNDQTRPGRPEGGEAMAMRALFALARRRFAA